MKLLRYGKPGFELPGAMDNEGKIRALSGLIEDVNGYSLTSLDLETVDLNVLPIVTDVARLGPCIGNVGKFICIGLNYVDHARESGMILPNEPEVFTKATSAISGPNDDIIKPLNSDKLDWEVELAIIIGKHTSYVSEKQAIDHIFDYRACLLCF